MFAARFVSDQVNFMRTLYIRNVLALIGPLIYRWYEIASVYGTTIKELIYKEFGDGIMSAIDFSMDIVRQPDPKGDRVNVVLSGKFLPYKTY